MRQLHPVAFHEQFAASGVYRFEQDMALAHMTEAWTIHRLPDQSLLARVDRDRRSKDTQNSILLEALLRPEGAVERFDVRVDYPQSSQVKQLKASYQFFDGRVEIGWQEDGTGRKEVIVHLPTKTLIYPGMWVFIGPVIRQIEAQKDQRAPVFFVDLNGSHKPYEVTGQVKDCSATRSGSEDIVVGQRAIAAGRYQLTGMGFDEQTKFWLDEHDMLVNYSDGYKHMLLTRYAPFSKTRS